MKSSSAIFDKIENLPRIGTGPTVSIQDICHELGPDSFIVIILVLHFLNAIPIPNPALVFFLGVAAALISVQVVIGQPSLWLPQYFLRKTISRDALSSGISKALPKLSILQRCAKHRLELLTTRKAARLFMVLIGILSLLMAFFLPIGNFLLSTGIVILCLGLLTQDGLFVLLGTGTAVLGVGWAIVVTGGLVLVVWVAIKSAIAGFMPH